MAALPAFSAAPISVSRFHPDGLELTIRAAGAATRALCGLKRGDSLGVRGPLGRGWSVGGRVRPRRRRSSPAASASPPSGRSSTRVLADRDRFGVDHA